MTAFAFPRLTAAVTAIALAVTGITATPVHAMNDKDRAALALVLGLGAVAVMAGQDDHRDNRRAVRPPPPRREFYAAPHHRHDRRRPHHRHQDWQDGYSRGDRYDPYRNW